MSENQNSERNGLITGLIAVAILGALTGYIAELIALFLLMYIVFQLVKLKKLYVWAQDVSIGDIPFDDGLLGQLAGHIQQCKKQRIQQKESVKYQLERFKKLIAVFPDGVVILSLSNNIQWFNDHAGKLLVLEKRDTGKPVNQLVRSPVFTRFLKDVSEESVVIDGLSVETNFSTEKIEIRVLPYGENERLLLVRDVTKVERANQMRKDFVSNASHELRTPLTVMKGYVEMLLLSTAGEEKYSPPLHKVEQQVIKMEAMIDELLALSRLEEGNVENTASSVNLRGLCEQIKLEFDGAAEKNEQVLVFNIEPSISLKANKVSLLTVVRNLVGNAIHYSARGSVINIGWAVNDRSEGVLFVKDAGQGIAARHLARLTERFYRISEKNALHKTGTGLGLAIVKHELERHEARLVIDSKVGEGSTFKCCFPAARVER